MVTLYAEEGFQLVRPDMIYSFGFESHYRYRNEIRPQANDDDNHGNTIRERERERKRYLAWELVFNTLDE